MNAAQALGLARSLAIYYGQPWKTRALKRFYAGLIRPGDLVFDIGAHVGSRTRILAGLGARVVALEPQPLFHRFLTRTLPRDSVTLLEEAVGRTPGEMELAISSRHPTVSSLSADWRGQVGDTAGFTGVRWDATHRVRVTTLDDLIARFGLPAFCKIDVEGMEADILSGLSTPVPLVAVEYLPAARAVAHQCLREFTRLGPYRFNAVTGEHHRFVAPQWVAADAAPAFLDMLCGTEKSGDLYACLDRAALSLPH